MTRLPSPYPHQVVANWIAANDDNALPHVPSVVGKTSSAIEKSSIAAERTHVDRTPRNITQIDGPSPFDYDVCARRARKMQAEAVAEVARTISKSIDRTVSNTISFLRNHWRTRQQIQRLSYLTPRLLDDMGIPHELQVRIRAQQAHRQLFRSHLHF